MSDTVKVAASRTLDGMEPLSEAEIAAGDGGAEAVERYALELIRDDSLTDVAVLWSLLRVQHYALQQITDHLEKGGYDGTSPYGGVLGATLGAMLGIAEAARERHNATYLEFGHGTIGMTLCTGSETPSYSALVLTPGNPDGLSEGSTADDLRQGDVALEFISADAILKPIEALKELHNLVTLAEKAADHG